MADESNVLFVRGCENKNSTVDEDIWDDSALIKAYDKAIKLAKEEIVKRIDMEEQSSEVKQRPQNSKQFRQTNKQHKKWTVGAPCRAIYSKDGQLYEAIIKNIFESTGTCLVKFVGYGNKEKVELRSLLASEGLQSQIAQQKDASEGKSEEENIEIDETNFPTSSSAKKFNGNLGEHMDCETEDAKPYKRNFMSRPSFNSNIDMMPPPPPLPPQLMATLPENDADALSSMLMSWYVSGFHTGYYHGLRQGRSNQEKRRNC